MYLKKPQKLAALGKSSEALSLLPQPGTGNDLRADIVRARIELNSDNPANALSTLTALATSHPNYMPAPLFQAVASYDLFDIPAAIPAIDSALQLQPQNDLALSYKALFLLASGQSSEAMHIWKNHGYSDNVDFRMRLIEHLETTWLQTRKYFAQTSHPLSVSSAKPSLRKATSCFYKHDYTGVLAHSAAPPVKDAEAAHLAAFASEMLNDYETAQQYLNCFLDQKEQWPDAFIALQARLLVREGKMAEAARHFARITTIGPEDMGSNYFLGIICLAYEKRAEARNYFRRALTAYMPDTLDFQWWKIEHILRHETP